MRGDAHLTLSAAGGSGAGSGSGVAAHAAGGAPGAAAGGGALAQLPAASRPSIPLPDPATRPQARAAGGTGSEGIASARGAPPVDASPEERALLAAYLDATRSSLWVVDPRRLQRLRACVSEARRWGELAALDQFWRELRVPEDSAVQLNWFQVAPGDPLSPEPPILLACACAGPALDATQQHAALPLGRIEPLFDPTHPAFHRWLDRDLDLAWHAGFLSAREVLTQLPERLDQACRASLTDWLYEHARSTGAPPDPSLASSLFELWAAEYAARWRAQVVAELTPLAEDDALLVVFTDY
jgi:hypothetical protein